MIARLTLAVLLLAAPGLAFSQPEREQLFISPSGEPFRAPEGQPYPVSAWFAAADANHDGALTRDEFIADALAFHARLDADKDGWLDGFEIGDYEKKVAPEILGRPDRGSVGGAGKGASRDRGADGARARGAVTQPYGQGRSGAGLYGLINEIQPVMGQDSDFNRRIDRKEVTAAARDRFAILDTDKDGKLMLETLPRTPVQRALADQR